MAKRNKTTLKTRTLDSFIVHLIVLMFAVIGLMRLGVVGLVLNRSMIVLFGNLSDVIYIIIVLLILHRWLFKRWIKINRRQSLALALSLVFILLANSYLSYGRNQEGFNLILEWFERVTFIYQGNLDAQGGFFGVLLYATLSFFIARAGTLIFLMIFGFVILTLWVDLKRVWTWLQSRLNQVSNDDAVEVNDSLEKTPVFMNPDEPTMPHKTPSSARTQSAATLRKIGDYTLPSLALLDDVIGKTKSNANTSAAQTKSKRLLEILSQFGVNATLIATHIGPAVTKFEVKPDSNVKITKIASIQDNIKMELAAKELRIEAPIPGRSAVGIEIPNVEMIPVRMLEMMNALSSDQNQKKLLFPLGKDLMGQSVYGEMDKMPHLLIAGATGSGKSVCVNAIIINYLLRTSPDELKLLLIDPKKVEFTPYHNIPHLISPVISDASEAAKALKVVVEMMENRYEIFSNVGVRNIASYLELRNHSNNESLEPMPWLVVIIDELADLMMVAGKDVEGSIQRITQLARAAGIHLIVATQRPSTDVITGIIKANIPSRIAFAVSSGIDSRTILDGVGAERLLGYGDMLFFPAGEPAPVRVQGVYVTDDEIRRITETVNLQRKPSFDDAFLNLSENENGSNGPFMGDDHLFEEVKNFILETGRASTSNIQRRFGLGYNRAARIIDALEQQGVVGPSQGSKPREVYGRK
jgi:S-DNA-T family DNA segregation ATPase FtsK/SpoIIIE